jgi:hypothetical protein
MGLDSKRILNVTAVLRAVASDEIVSETGYRLRSRGNGNLSSGKLRFVAAVMLATASLFVGAAPSFA